jgi:hypothetical protein
MISKTKRSLKRRLSLPVCSCQRISKDCRFSICDCRLKIMFFRKLIVGRLSQTPISPQRFGFALASLRRQRNASAAPHSGDNSAVAPPVPIPNTAVKRCSPDGSTAIGRARVGRRQNKTPLGLPQRGFCFSFKKCAPIAGPLANKLGITSSYSADRQPDSRI